jgi:simple sugar transport system permease protein
MDSAAVIFLLATMVAFAAPLIYAAMGELISERAGVINIELEGMMLAGAFCGVWGALAAGDVGFGFVAGALGGIAVALAHGVLCFLARAEQVVSGVVLNILVLGLTTFAIAPVFGASAGRPGPTLVPLPVPLLADIPVIGRVLFNQTIGVYGAFVAVVGVWWLVSRTTTGLAIQAVGEVPAAAASMGINVRRQRWMALLACGALAGIGGAQLTLSGLGTFTQNVTAGSGFVALAAVVFGRWRPAGALVAVLLFTLVQAIQVNAQVEGIKLPYQLLVMAPYLVTVVALALFVGRSRAPRALGSNY